MCTNTTWEGEKFEIEEVKVRVSGFNKETLLVTSTEGTTGKMREVEEEEARERDEEYKGVQRKNRQKQSYWT